MISTVKQRIQLQLIDLFYNLTYWKLTIIIVKFLNSFMQHSFITYACNRTEVERYTYLMISFDVSLNYAHQNQMIFINLRACSRAGTVLTLSAI